YRLGVRDQIDYIYPQGYLNIARTRTWGVEVQADADLGHGVVARAAYAYADAQDLSTGLPLLRVPRNKASAGLEWTHDRWQGSLDVRGQSQAADVFGEIQPFVVADLAGAYAVTRNVSLTARIENVANRHYQEAFGYGEPGFGAFVGLRLRN
ncbi:MAG: TonB-dependent receptor domain-containing protein, partial [Caulobacteraceae bacterium]